MSGYVLYLLLAILIVVFWRARAGRTYDQLLDAADHHHHQVIATIKAHPKGGTWAIHKRWMAKKN